MDPLDEELGTSFITETTFCIITASFLTKQKFKFGENIENCNFFISSIIWWEGGKSVPDPPPLKIGKTVIPYFRREFHGEQTF